MFKGMFSRLSLAIVAIAFASLSASAQANLGPQSGLTALSSSSQLNVTAQVVTAVQLDISTAAGGATVVGSTGSASTGIFSLNLGEVSGIGTQPSASGVSVSDQPGGALYSTPITLTPRFSGFAANLAQITVKKSATAGNAAGQAAVREGSAANSMTTLGTVLPGVVSATATNNTPITRYVGMFIANTSGASAVTGSLEAQVIYEVTVP